ncbi:MAG TPA: chorismate mutase, partial [Alphaproteobacteria bacterium]
MTVEDIRHKIDSLDNQLHDLLMERAELVLKIGEEKRKNNVQVIQP